MRKKPSTGTAGVSGPEFVRFFGPLLDALRKLGDSGRPKEITGEVSSRLKIPDEELDRTLQNGASRIANQVAWARFYLAKAGYIDTSRRGVWSLTDKGRRTRLDHAQALEIFRRVQAGYQGADGLEADDLAPQEGTIPASPDDNETDTSFEKHITDRLRSVSPAGFERLCVRILREVGFEDVHVTGRSGDGGIDGYGTLRINRLVTNKVLIQCKRYTAQVSPSHIRDFRGAMHGRVDRGIFLTTGTFSTEAQREAAREGALPIELVDLQRLIGILKELGLGVRTKTIHVVDEEFFDDYRE